MRTLELNKTPLWLVDVLDQEPVLDDSGFETGEFKPSYSVPRKVRLHLYPANGKIKDDLFGKDAQLDMISVSTDVILTKDSLLLTEETIVANSTFTYEQLENLTYMLLEDLTYSGINVNTQFDYKVSMISHSLNGWAYGLELRVGGK